MKNQRYLFITGVVLLLLLPLAEEAAKPLSLLSPFLVVELSRSIQFAWFSVLFAYRWISTVAPVLYLTGIVLLLIHYYRYHESAERAYRVLDRIFGVTIVFMGFSLPYFVGLYRYPSPTYFIVPVFSAGYAALIFLCSLCWALGLWRAKWRRALLFSICCMVLGYLPVNTANSPAAASNQISRWHSQVAKSESPDRAAQEDAPVTSCDVMYYRAVALTQQAPSWAAKPLFLVFLAYTWMRMGGAGRRRESRPDGDMQAPPGTSSCDWRYGTSEIILLFSLPVVIAGGLVLTWIQRANPLFSYYGVALFEMLLMAALVAAAASIYILRDRVSVICEARTRRRLGGSLLVVLFLAAGNGIAFLLTFSAQLKTPTDTATRMFTITMAVVCTGLFVAGAACWLQGVRKGLRLYAVCGAVICASLASPFYLLSGIYPQAPSGESARTSGQDSSLDRVIRTDTENVLKQLSGQTTAVNIVFQNYIRVNIVLLMLLTLTFHGSAKSTGTRLAGERSPDGLSQVDNGT